MTVRAAVELALVEADQALEDAKRWRRLRAHHWTTDRLVVAHPHDLKLGSMTYSGDRLDAAIDAALQERARIPKPEKLGEENGAAKLREVDVRSIRAAIERALLAMWP